MASRRTPRNLSVDVEEYKSNLLCEYYLWVRWCNIREINGYYIYNGMKGNKLSFIHQQNSSILIYYHTYSSSISNQLNDGVYSYINDPLFIMSSSIPEDTEKDVTGTSSNIITKLSDHSPSSSASYSMNTNSSQSPLSSPPQSPISSKIGNIIPKLTPSSSFEDILYNNWCISYESDILYYTKDIQQSNNINPEYPPSYGWKYNDKNLSELPKMYLNKNNMINFSAPPPGITRIPIIPEPNYDDNNIDINHILHNVNHNNKHKNGYIQKNLQNIIITNNYLPLQIIDIVYKPDKNIGFQLKNSINNKLLLEIDNIKQDSNAYSVGLKQGDIILSINEEDPGSNIPSVLNMFNDLMWNNMISICICRRIFDHIMIIVASCGNILCNGKYYYHHLDEYDSPVFMQDILSTPMIIRKANYDYQTSESLWTISDKNEDYYIGLSIDMMPPNYSWDPVGKNGKYPSPKLEFYNRNQKINNKSLHDIQKDTLLQNTVIQNHNQNNDKNKIHVMTLQETISHPSKYYLDPIIDTTATANANTTNKHYRTPSWKRDDNILNISGSVSGSVSVFNKNVLYEYLQDINASFYNYWLNNKKLYLQIDKLNDIISQHRNKFILIRKELFQQKSREEDLLDKINSLQSHSRQVSSLSALFTNDYQLDVDELRDMYNETEKKQNNNDNDNNDNMLVYDNDAIDVSKLTNNDKYKELEAEIEKLKLKCNLKDLKIKELEDNLSAQTDQFNSKEAYYIKQNNEFKQKIDKLQNINKDNEKQLKEYDDIDAFLEYNDSSSSSSDHSDDDDNNTNTNTKLHIRRSSKPWMILKDKMMKKRKKAKEKQKKYDNDGNDVLHLPAPKPEPEPAASLKPVKSQQELTPTPTPTPSPVINSPINVMNDIVASSSSSSSGGSGSGYNTVNSGSSDESADHLSLPTSSNHKLQSLVSLTGVPQVSIVSGMSDMSDIDDNKIMNHNHNPSLPSTDPLLHHKQARSKLESMYDISKEIKEWKDKHDKAFENINEWKKKYNNNKQILDEYINKYNNLENQNKYIIKSKFLLLQNTSNEINKLTNIINILLNINDNNQNGNNLKKLIKQMLLTK